MASDSIPEEWRPVEGWPYEVSNLGRVRRVSTRHGAAAPIGSGVLRVQVSKHDGRHHVRLWMAGKSKTCRVHVLVATAFHGPRPSAGHHAAHWDGDVSNNSAANIRWATAVENSADKERHGTVASGSRNGRSRLSDHEAAAIYALATAKAIPQSAIADQFGVCRTTVYLISRRRTWKCMHDTPSRPSHQPR